MKNLLNNIGKIKTSILGFRLTFKNLSWIVFGFTLVLLVLPLTRYFSFEFCAVEGLFLSFTGGLLYILMSRANTKFKVHEFAFRYLLIFLIPWAMQAIKILFAGYSCFWHGTRFYLIITMPSIFVGVGIAASALITSRKNGIGLYILYYIIMALWPLWILYYYQQLYFYNPLIGIFPGTVYDELIPISSLLIIHQIVCNCIAVTLVIIAQSRVASRSRRTPIVMMLILAVLVAWYVSPISPFVTPHSQIEKQLQGRIETEHFLIYFKEGSLTKEAAKDIGLLHEVYYEQLKQFYQTEPQEKIHSHIFNSPEDKYQLLGTAAADFAKPWKNEIYISSEFIDNTLKHELSHVFTAAFGYSPYKLSHSFDPALLEGAATASSPIYDDFPLNYMAFQALKMDSTLSVSSLFGGLSFFGGVSSTSYCISGSFCRYLINSCGILNFRNAYKNGFSKSIYGKSLRDLAKEYKANLFSQGFVYNKDLADYYFRGQGLLQKTSPHYVAELKHEAALLMEQEKYTEALEVLKGTHKNLVQVSLMKVKILEKLERFDEAIVLLREIREVCAKSGACRDIELALANCYFMKGDFEKAGSMYQDLREHVRRPFFQTICASRLQAVQSREHAKEIFGDDNLAKFRLYSDLLSKTGNSSLVPVVLILAGSAQIPYSTSKDVIAKWFGRQKTVDEYNVLWLLRFALNHRDTDFAKDILYKNDSKSIIFSPAISEERKKMRAMELILERGFQCKIWESHE
jgi:tetratricopeptide (TPR) repeat protein